MRLANKLSSITQIYKLFSQPCLMNRDDEEKEKLKNHGFMSYVPAQSSLVYAHQRKTHFLKV